MSEYCSLGRDEHSLTVNLYWPFILGLWPYRALYGMQQSVME